MIDYDNEFITDDYGIDFENYDLDELVNETYKEAHPLRYQIVVRIYTPKIETKTSGGLILATSTIEKKHQDDKFINFVGLIVKMGPGCYEDISKYNNIKVGDWVMFPRAAAHTYEHKGLTSASITEDRLIQRVDDPRVIKRISCD